MKFQNLFVVDGQVDRELDKHKIFLMVLSICINIIPLIILIVYTIINWLSPTLLTCSTIWSVWNIVATITLFIPRDKELSNTTWYSLCFLYVFFALLVVIPVVLYLKTKYPNSDDPDDILRFERKRKIKSIL